MGRGKGGHKKNRKNLVPRSGKEREISISHKFKNYLGSVTGQLRGALRGQGTRYRTPPLPRACAVDGMEATVSWESLGSENGHLNNSQGGLMIGRVSSALELPNYAHHHKNTEFMNWLKM